MTFRLRSVLLLFAVACYFLQMCMPLLSVSGDMFFISPLHSLSMWATNISPYKYNYMTIGLIPFVLASVVLEVFKLLWPHSISKCTDGRLLNCFRTFLFLFSCLLSFYFVTCLDSSMMRYGRVLTFLELMISVFFVEQLLAHIKSLNMLSRPVLVLFSVNVAASSVAGLFSSSKSENILYSAIVVLLVLICVVVDMRANYRKINKAVVYV